MRVILADLRVNELTGGEIPLGIANIASYAQHAVAGLDVELVIDPHELDRSLEKDAPDALLLSNYCWNKNISLRMAARAKRLHPECVVVMGGPNISQDEGRREKFLSENPFVDFYVLHDGEIPCASLLGAISRLGGAQAVKENPEGLTSTAFLQDGAYVEVPALERLASLDDIPSPYLSDHLDRFFAMRLLPKIQSSRGCPYTCAYCNMGDRFHGVMPRMSVERFRADMEIIVDLMNRHGYEFRVVNLIDNNFGLFPEDVQKAQFIRHLQETTGYPSMITMYTAKVVNERVFRAASILKDMAYVSNTSQTLHMPTLKAIHRPNKGVEAFVETSRRLKREGFRTQSEVISGLPLETWESFRRGVDVLDGLGFDDYIIYQLTIIDGAPMDDPQYLARYGMEIKYRLYPNSVIEIGGETIGEFEKVVVKTSTLSEQEYHAIRLFTFLLRLQVALQQPALFGYLRERHGLTGPALADAVMARVRGGRDGGNRAAGLLRRFADDARAELLDEPVLRDAPAPVNLVHAYRARILANAFGDLCALYRQVVDELLPAGNATPDEARLLDAMFEAVTVTDLRSHLPKAIAQGAGEAANVQVTALNPDELIAQAQTGTPLAGMRLAPGTFRVPQRLREDVKAFVRLAGKGDEHLILAYSTLTQMPFRLVEEAK
ncbi:MAG: cobalamin B12-binding domain-containing [Desulfovibrionaceae bacterium]|nr:MAG: cobalamin B12-binding domain-containing [Desulfovibrionaceae bacterium]